MDDLKTQVLMKGWIANLMVDKYTYIKTIIVREVNSIETIWKKSQRRGSRSNRIFISFTASQHPHPLPPGQCPHMFIESWHIYWVSPMGRTYGGTEDKNIDSVSKNLPIQRQAEKSSLRRSVRSKSFIQVFYPANLSWAYTMCQHHARPWRFKVTWNKARVPWPNGSDSH